MSSPEILPMIDPNTGTGMSICPAKEDNALIETSIDKVSLFTMKKSKSIFPSLYWLRDSHIPNAAVAYAEATHAGVAV